MRVVFVELIKMLRRGRRVEVAAKRLGTAPRFIRRLVAERRIAFAKLGKHVRIESAALDAFVAAGRVVPAVPASVPGRPDSTWKPGLRRAVDMYAVSAR